MYALTVEEALRIEREAIHAQKLSKRKLMENSGRAVSLLVKDILPEKGNVIIICGAGNSGGDGFAAARFIERHNYHVEVFTLGSFIQYSPAARSSYADLEFAPTLLDESKLSSFRTYLMNADVVVDSIYDLHYTGHEGSVVKEVITIINETKKFRNFKVISTDVPSGLDPNTGAVSDCCVDADYTLSYTCPKIGCFLKDGPDQCGRILSANIGIDENIVKENATHLVLSRSRAKSLLPKRPRHIHKRSAGCVLVIAGSKGMTGAAHLTSRAALLSGAGYIKLLIPESLHDIMETKLTEVLIEAMPGTAEGTLSRDGLPAILEMAKYYDAVAIGPGLGQNDDTRAIVLGLLSELKIPMVVDADALNVLAGYTDILKNRDGLTILTPHPGEFARLTDKTVEEVEQNRWKLVTEFANKFNTTVVLKGTYTLVDAKGQYLAINNAGNSGLATLGTGDVLTGLISGILAQKISFEGQEIGRKIVDSANLGVYLHGASADHAANEKTVYCLTASDVLDNIHKAMQSLIESKW